MSDHPHKSAEELTDNQLALWAQKNVQYFTPLYDRFFQPVYRYYFSRLRHHEEAEDLTSETFLKLYEKLGSYRERGVPFSVWVYKIAYHSLVDHVRHKGRHGTESLEDLEPSREPSCNFDLDKIDSALLTEKLWAAIALLPKRQQDIWSLKLASDLPYKDIAEILGMSENHVNVDISRSLKTLKKHLSHLSS